MTHKHTLWGFCGAEMRDVISGERLSLHVEMSLRIEGGVGGDHIDDSLPFCPVLPFSLFVIYGPFTDKNPNTLPWFFR